MTDSQPKTGDLITENIWGDIWWLKIKTIFPLFSFSNSIYLFLHIKSSLVFWNRRITLHLPSNWHHKRNSRPRGDTVTRLPPSPSTNALNPNTKTLLKDERRNSTGDKQDRKWFMSSIYHNSTHLSNSSIFQRKSWRKRSIRHLYRHALCDACIPIPARPFRMIYLHYHRL